MDIRLASLVAASMLLLVAAVPVHSAATAPTTRCTQTEYAAYRACVHATRHKRQSADNGALAGIVVNGTLPADAGPAVPMTCQHLHFECRIACANDTNCEALCPICPVRGDQQVVADNDDYRSVVIETGDGHRERFQARIEAGRNITTIIRLTNVLNTTNHIHIPTNVTTNNVHNVNLHTNHTGNHGASASESSSTGGDFGLGWSATGPCCLVVRPPRNCRTSPSAGTRCHHRRQRTCGTSVCKARVMHTRVQRRCNRSGGDCRKRLVYVVPSEERCVRTPSWPYVVCGTVVDRRDADYGDYDDAAHGRPERSYRHGAAPPMLPPPWAAYYYRPPWMDYMGGGWGAPPPPPSRGHRQHHPGGDRDVYYEDEVSAGGPATDADDQYLEDAASGEWQVENSKCKVVSLNGTVVEIKNCTAASLDDNQFAAEPRADLTADARDGDDGDDARPKREAFELHHRDGDDAGQRRRHREYADDRYRRRQILEDFEYNAGDEGALEPVRRAHRRHHRRQAERKYRSEFSDLRRNRGNHPLEDF